MPPGEGEPLVRPFLHRGPGRFEAPEPSSGDAHAEVRPYLITGGRTASARVDVAMETIVVVSDAVRAGRANRIAFERAAVLQECDQPRSVAEVAAHLGMPLVVALVLVSDLVVEGLLEASSTTSHQADDVAFLERLIDGVNAL